jgi:hypothetical protein
LWDGQKRFSGLDFFFNCHMRNLLTPIAVCRWRRKELPNW